MLGKVDAEQSVETAAMVAMVLQPSTVSTRGDVTGIRKNLAIGVTQGGPASPALFSKTTNVVTRKVNRAVKPYLLPDDPMPIKVFADDVVLQVPCGILACLALMACGEMEVSTGQRWNTKKKSAPCEQMRGR